jgi:outer membrane PBP1 activator LpoA protein
MTKLKRLAIITLFAILATACSTQQPIKGGGSSSTSSKASTASINDLLAQAQLAPALQAAQLKLQAANIMLSKSQFAKTVTLIDSIDSTKLTASLNFKIALAKAAALIGLQNGNSAINLLSSLPDDMAENNLQKLQKYQLLANAYGLTNQLTKETLSLIAASEFSYQASDILPINEKIWQLFKTIDLAQLKQLNEQEDNNYNQRGWLALAIALKEQPNGLKLASSDWYKRWSSHIAAKHQPQEFAELIAQDPLLNSAYQSSHILVALPTSGKYAKGAKAILKGIKLAAGKGALSDIQVSYIDSATFNSAQSIIDKANQLTADVIVGPLDRGLVSQFAQIKDLPLPVLALNSSPLANSNLYQFALTDDDEIRDAAQRAFNDGRKNIAVLAPEGDKGSFAANTFSNEFNALGGQVASTTYYNTKDGDVTHAVAQMLQLNRSRIRGLQKKLKTAHLRKAIRNMIRKDIDGIFLFASSSDAYQIGPSILYFYADNLPLYATSKIYTGKSNPVKNLDLNGMMFGDLPWVLSPSENKGIIARTASKTDTRFGRLYAFGMDALTLAPKLYDLSEESDTRIQGETGKLSVSDQNIVQKTLPWAKFIDGEVQLLPAQ